MSTFDSYADSPFQIRTDGQDITISFNRTGPNSGRISWNIPEPALGCTAENQAYDGIVITLDNTHVTLATNPVDKTVYISDPTADTNLHAGDKIGTALVVGAFYGDKTITFMDITGLQPNTPVYVSGYAVDVQHRYHTEGVHAYSLDYSGANGTPDTTGYHIAEFTPTILTTDPTGLVVATPYDFEIKIDGAVYTITVNGTDAATYSDLLNAIQLEVAQLENPQSSLLPPNTNAFFWNATSEELFQWDGYQHNKIDAIVELTDPTSPIVGEHWYHPTTGVLSVWNGATWDVVNVIRYHQDPTILNCDDYWFTGTNVYQWDGNTWCEKILWNQTNDPSLAVPLPCGTHWYDTSAAMLYEWKEDLLNWNQTTAILLDTDPNSPLPNSYWFDETNNLLNQFVGAVWVNVAAHIGITEPTVPVANQYWYNTDTEELWKRDGANTTWLALEVLPWTQDPIIRTSCDLWWNTTTDVLYVWDVTTTMWDMVTNFIQSATDPYVPTPLTGDDIWFNPDDDTLVVWNGAQWSTVTFISQLTDPTIAAVGDVWFNTTTEEWNVWSGVWTVFDPIDSIVDPANATLLTGTYWYDTTLNTLQMWNGALWVVIAFTTTPLTPMRGTLWFNTTLNVLMVWDGTTWANATPLVLVEINSDGNIVFTGITIGAESCIIVTDIDLFSSLVVSNIFVDPVPGSDGVSDIPMYQEVGIGDDGSTDERRELMDSIRQQLGYPVVDVELTKYQLDTAVTAGIESLRKRSGAAYKKGFFFLNAKSGQSRYILSSKPAGFNHIVGVQGMYRMTSAFMTTAFGGGVYGQVVLQHLYNMGTFDLLSYHMVSEYIEQMEMLFATRIVFQWDEYTRALDILQTIATDEVILVDASVERSEQELLTSRWTKGWIEKYASAEARTMLAEIRGKYASLPGAGGGVALNAGELMVKANEDKMDCYQQLDDWIANNPEEWGMGAHFVIG